MDAFFATGVGVYSKGFIVSKNSQQDSSKLFEFLEMTSNLIVRGKKGLAEFRALEALWHSQIPEAQVSSEQRQIISSLKSILDKYEIDPSLVSKFFTAKKYDFTKFSFETAQDFNNYAAGAYESVGVLIARVSGVSRVQDESIAAHSKAVLYFNLLRNLEVDVSLGRNYFPKTELRRYGLPSLTYKAVNRRPGAFREFLEAQVNNYFILQKQAKLSFKYLPYKKRVRLKVKIDLANWQMRQYAINPFLVFQDNTSQPKFIKLKHTVYRMISA